LLPWFKALPEERYLSGPHLGITRAYPLRAIGEYESGERLLQRIERDLESQGIRDQAGALPENRSVNISQTTDRWF